MLPCPFKATRAADFNFSQWFASIVFSLYFLYPFDTVFEIFMLLANILMDRVA